MSAVESILRECGLEAGIGYWRFDGKRNFLHWPSGFGPARDESYGSWFALGDFGQTFAPDDRPRFFEYFQRLFEAGSRLSTLEIAIQTKAGSKMLRIEGKSFGEADQRLAVGLVRDISRRHEAEDRARSLTNILDTVMISASNGIIVMDGQRRVRRANRTALKLFGIDPGAAAEMQFFGELEARIPRQMLAEMAGSQQTRSAVGGTLPVESAPCSFLTWRANPWGRSGIVLVVEPALTGAPAMTVSFPAAPADRPNIVGVPSGPTPVDAPANAAPPATPPTPSAPPAKGIPAGAMAALAAIRAAAEKAEANLGQVGAARPTSAASAAAPEAASNSEPMPIVETDTSTFASDRSRAMLDYVHHPVLIIQTRDATIDYANKAAREKLGLKQKGRFHINNMYEVSGRHAPNHTYVTPDRVNHLLTLPMGARISRMNDVDPDLMFVEYQ